MLAGSSGSMSEANSVRVPDLAEGSQGQRGERPDSPCIKVCALDRQGYCMGCLRTVEEIARWTAMSPAEQWHLIALLAARRAQLGESGEASQDKTRG
jgi:predicted Fe-S protein YdhL (DUF1289 family)